MSLRQREDESSGRARTLGVWHGMQARRSTCCWRIGGDVKREARVVYLPECAVCAHICALPACRDPRSGSALVPGGLALVDSEGQDLCGVTSSRTTLWPVACCRCLLHAPARASRIKRDGSLTATRLEGERVCGLCGRLAHVAPVYLLREAQEHCMRPCGRDRHTVHRVGIPPGRWPRPAPAAASCCTVLSLELQF